MSRTHDVVSRFRRTVRDVGSAYRRTVIAVFAAALCASALGAQTPARTLFERARMVEETNAGNVLEAVQLYEQVAAQTKEDPALAAQAQLRVGILYERLGRRNDARLAYELVLSRHASQRAIAADAQTRLGAFREAEGPALRHVWTLPARGTQASNATADGRYTAYVDWGRRGDLFLRDLIAGTERRITEWGTTGIAADGSAEYADSALLSRDGRELAYWWYRGARGELRIANLEGEGIPSFRRLLTNDDTLWIFLEDWSPDGQSMLATLQRTDRTSQLASIDVKDGSLRVLRSMEWRQFRGAYFSPDGQHVAFDLDVTGTSSHDIFAMALDSGEQRPIVVHPSNDMLVGWSPDGSRVLFTSDRGGQYDLWAMPVNESTRPMASLVRAGVGRQSQIGITSAGTLLYLTSDRAPDQPARVRVADIDLTTGRIATAPSDLHQNYAEFHVYPQWSPDGKYLASVSGSTRGVGGVNISLRAVGTDVDTVVRPALRYMRFFSFSPDGRSVAAAGGDFQGRHGLFRIDLESGDTQPILFGKNVDELTGPVWSADSGSLIFARDDESGIRAFIRRDLTTGQEIELARGTFPGTMGRRPTMPRTQTIYPTIGSLNVSPDRQYIATGQRAQATDLYALVVISTANGTARTIYEAPAEEGTFVRGWAPDSESVVVMRTVQGKREALRITLSGEVTSVPGLSDLVPSGLVFQALPGSTLVAFPVPAIAVTSTQGTQELWAMEGIVK